MRKTRSSSNDSQHYLNFFHTKVEKRQLWVRSLEWLKLNFASCAVHQTRSLDVLILYMYFIEYTSKHVLWTKPKTWLLVPGTQFHKKNRSRLFYVFYPYEGYRSVTPLDAARVNRTSLKIEAEHVWTGTINNHRSDQHGLIGRHFV